MGLEFIDRTLKTSSLVLLIFLPFGLYYMGVFPALAIFFGGVWGMLNLIFISALVRETIRPDKNDIDKGKAAGLALIKFPLLYASLYGLLRVSQFDPIHLLIGFSSLLAVIILKVLGRVLMKVDDQRTENVSAQRVA